jgi:hypothetical protein
MEWLKDFIRSLNRTLGHDKFGAVREAMKDEKFSQEDIDRVVERMKSREWENAQW